MLTFKKITKEFPESVVSNLFINKCALAEYMHRI